MLKIRLKNTDSTEDIYTDARVNITHRIEEGLTALVVGIGYTQEKEASRIAVKNRSYYLPAYMLENGRLQQYGYAIPK